MEAMIEPNFGATKLPYVLELPDLRYDPAELFAITERNSQHWQQYKSPTGVLWDFDEMRFDSLIAEPHIQQIVSQISPELRITNARVSYNRTYPNGVFHAHVDPGRYGAIMFNASVKKPAAVYWEDDQKNVLHEHTYTYPALINSKIRHGVWNDDQMRVIFQISVHIPFDQVVELHIKNRLLINDTRR